MNKDHFPAQSVEGCSDNSTLPLTEQVGNNLMRSKFLESYVSCGM